MNTDHTPAREDKLDVLRTALHLLHARLNGLVDHGDGATHEQLVELAELVNDEAERVDSVRDTGA